MKRLITADDQADFQRLYDAFKRLYEALEESFHITLRGLRNEVRDSLRDKNVPDFITYEFKVGVIGLLNAGHPLGVSIRDTKSVPRKKIKKFEKAYKAFSRVRKPRHYVKWWLANKGSMQLFLEAKDWPFRGTVDDETPDIYRLGPVTVTNMTSTEDVKAINKLLTSAMKKITSSGVPGFKKVLYGDVMFVGDLARKRSVAAWYVPRTDKMYVQMTKRFSKERERVIVHEFGHRFWGKFLSKNVQKEWDIHHSNIKHRSDKIDMPAVGDKASFVKGNPVITDNVGGYLYMEGGSRIERSRVYKYLRKRAELDKFPTHYASTDHEEHFCEALSMYAIGTLKEPHLEAFERIIVNHGPAVAQMKLAGMVSRVALIGRIARQYTYDSTTSPRDIHLR